MENALIFALVWGIGGSVDEFTREKWNGMVNELIMGEDVKEKYKLIDLPSEWEPMTIPCKLPDQKSLFDCYFNAEQLNWTKWEKTVPAYQIDKDSSFVQLIIPTTDSIRVNKLIRQLVTCQKHILICGLTGTGKSISVASELEQSFNNEEYAYISMGFSAQTSAN
jgi:dynein heavy chain